MKVSWTESIDPDGSEVTYNLLLEDIPVLTETSLLTHTFTELIVNKTYSGKIIAIDNTGLRTISDFTFTTDPAVLSIDIGEFAQIESTPIFETDITWTSPYQSQSAEPVTYTVSVNGVVLLENSEATTVKATNLPEATNFTVKVVATIPSNTVELEQAFSTPELPSDFSVSKKYVGYTAVHLVWTKAEVNDSSPVVYDVYWKDQLIEENFSDTSIVIRDLPHGTYNWAKIRAKSSQGKFFRQKGADWIMLKIKKLSESQLYLNVYNISDNSVSIFGNRTNNSDPEFQNTGYVVYLNNTKVYSTGCTYVVGGGGSGYPDITGLMPNTTYSIKLKVAYPHTPFDPFYETVSFVTTAEKIITTYDTPVPDAFELTADNIQPTTADLSWRIKIFGGGCSPGTPIETIKIYLNDVLQTNLDARGAGEFYQLSGLTSGTTYDVRIEYLALSFPGYNTIKNIQKTITFTTP
jgi:hypothetical protein